jgi:hypothetical protein
LEFLLKLNIIIDHLLRNYVVLYGQDEHSRMRVLDQLYFTIGNGFDWKDGEMEPDEPFKPAISDEEYLKDLRDFEIRTSFFGGPMPTFSPVNHMSPVAEMSLGVNDDFLLGAMEILDFASTCSLDFHMERPERKNERNLAIMNRNRVRLIRDEIIERFEHRLEKLDFDFERGLW